MLVKHLNVPITNQKCINISEINTLLYTKELTTFKIHAKGTIKGRNPEEKDQTLKLRISLLLCKYWK